MKKVLFACTHNAGRSQMAAAWFNQMVDPAYAVAVSAGTQPAARIHPQVAAAMNETGITLDAVPQRLTEDVVRGADVLVTMGCNERCPIIPDVKVVDWPLRDPKNQPLETVRDIRDEIRDLVSHLIDEEGIARRAHPPVACTLSADDLRQRREELLPGLAQLAIGLEKVNQGVKLRFAPAPDIVSAIARVVDVERRCCAFLRFEILVDAAGGPPEAQPLLAELTAGGVPSAAAALGCPTS
jgi:arsenate reductase